MENEEGYEDLHDFIKELKKNIDKAPPNLLIVGDYSVDSFDTLRSSKSSSLNNQNLLVKNFYKPISRII
ncbi:hypothetical protein [Mucilaginibacter sp. OK268]|uniref:hypothetical protein n=1 Tax=Mucilaginibacter sp. OK268 TaxID=1881048 RepID=UPI000B8094CA|nr:hypothetical protein [Mucilaginibacter sp. OK268]